MNKKIKLNKMNKGLIDQDYWSQLSDKDKAYLNQFNKEYYEAIYKEEDRVIHPPKFDQDLKDARSAKRKDGWNIWFANHTLETGHRDFEENNMDVYLENKGMWFDDDELSKLKKIGEKQAIEILRAQAADAITNKIDKLEDILSDLQRDTLKIYINARKNI